MNGINRSTMNRELQRARGAEHFVLKTLAHSLMLLLGTQVHAMPVGGVVTAGSAAISSSAGSTTITQSSQNAAINWQSFNIGASEAVRFVQPNSSSVALNRVLGADPSSILGSLSANGKVFLVNPNGILFSRGSSVNVSGLLASTRNITDSDFMAGQYRFTGTGSAAVSNQGTINADGGYIALLGAEVSNEGTLVARLGTVALAAGDAITLDVAGDGLLNVTVNEGAVNALVQNGGLIQADGGYVLLTTQAAGSLLQTAVNNTGVIQAQTIENLNGTIMLMGDMQSGTTNVGGTLDASAPNGGNGGFIETSAAHVNVADDAKITTVAPQGQTGTWLIDPLDFYIAAAGGNISGLALSGQLVNNNVTISSPAGAGNGDIFVNDVVSWTAVPGTSPTTLTLDAVRDVTINSAITAVDGSLSVCCGRDVNVNAAISVTRGSVLLAGGRNANVLAAITVAEYGNLTICAGQDVTVSAPITLDNGTLIPERSLGLSRGLVLSAGTAGTGPGVAGGTLIFNPGTPATVTAAPTTIYYNPVTYGAPTDYATNIIGTAPTQFMLVFPDGADKAFDGTTVTTFTGLKGAPPGVTLDGAGTANFDTAAVGLDKIVTFTGFGLAGASAGSYAFANSCCGPAVSRTTASITPAIVVIPPVVEPPVVVPPVVVPPVVEPPVVVPPVVEPPVEVLPAVVLPPVMVPPAMVLPVTPSNWMPAVVTTAPPPELLTLVVAPPPPPPVAVEPLPVMPPPVAPPPPVEPPKAPPRIYVAPPPPKPDRN